MKTLWIWALLAVLLSYSYDFECLLESQGCLQQQTHQAQAEIDSTCAQPSLMPAVVALLPTCTKVVLPALRAEAVEPIAALPLEAPPQPQLSVPLGLRAPPLA